MLWCSQSCNVLSMLCTVHPCQCPHNLQACARKVAHDMPLRMDPNLLPQTQQQEEGVYAAPQPGVHHSQSGEPDVGGASHPQLPTHDQLASLTNGLLLGMTTPQMMSPFWPGVGAIHHAPVFAHPPPGAELAQNTIPLHLLELFCETCSRPMIGREGQVT